MGIFNDSNSLSCPQPWKTSKYSKKNIWGSNSEALWFQKWRGWVPSCQRTWLSLCPIWTITPFSWKMQTLSVWSLHYGTCRRLPGQQGKSFCLQPEDKHSNHRIHFSAPLSPHFKKVWIANLCCLLPRECQVTSKAVMLSFLHAKLADSSGCSTRISLRCTEHFRWWLTALPDICMIIALFSVCYSEDSTAHKKQIGASWAAAPGE